jgi:ACS family hexuronate transporter-like MFS transporter
MAPSRRRWVILCLIFSAIVLNYFDRQIVSILKPLLCEEFHIEDRGYATLLNVFTICYAAMYPVAGWLVDRAGVRRMMLVGIGAWSASCIGAALSQTLGAFTFFRGVLGLAEPIAFPAQLRAVTAWFPGTLRATANSVSVAGSSIGSIVAPPLVAWVTLKLNWHASFLIPGILGLSVALLWILIYREPPADYAQSFRQSDPIAAAEGPAFTWLQLWRTRTLWGLILCRFISDPVWYFCLFWLPGYLQDRSGLSLAQVGAFGWIPFLAADLGGIATAGWSDRMVKRGGAPLKSRKKMLCTVALLGPICALVPWLPHPAATIAIFCVIGAVCLSWLFSLSVVIAESFPASNVGSVLGIAAGFGAVGAIVFNTYVGRMMETIGSSRIFLVMAVLHPLAAVILWTMTRPERPSNSFVESECAVETASSPY